MATLQIGHYPICSRTSEHAFAVMDSERGEYRFQCYGGVNGPDRFYPADYYRNLDAWHTRDSAKTSYRKLSCHVICAILLAQ